MATSILSKFEFSAVSKKGSAVKEDPVVAARNKMLTAIAAQMVYAAEFVKDGVIAERTKAARRKIDGTWKTVDVTKRPLAMFFEAEGNYYVTPKYGARPLQLGDGKHSIKVGASKNIVPMLKLLYKATEMKELDKAIGEARKRKS